MGNVGGFVGLEEAGFNHCQEELEGGGGGWRGGGWGWGYCDERSDTMEKGVGAYLGEGYCVVNGGGAFCTEVRAHADFVTRDGVASSSLRCSLGLT